MPESTLTEAGNSDRLEHRQLLGAIVALVLGDDWARPFFKELGYALNAVEPPMLDQRGERFEPDVHLVNEACNVSVLVECKTGTTRIRHEQIECYLRIDGTSIIEQGHLTIEEPHNHRVDVLFVATADSVPGLMNAIANVVGSAGSTSPPHGVVDVSPGLVTLAHGSLTHGDLEASLRNGWPVDVWQLPLERIPYTHHSPDYDIAQFILQTIAQFFVSNRASFTIEDLCANSNPWWEYLGDHRQTIRRRVRKMLSQLRRTALKGWIDTSPPGASATSEWRFTKRSSTRASVVGALQRRSMHYVHLLREKRDPRPEDFEDIEQLPLPWPFSDPS